MIAGNPSLDDPGAREPGETTKLALHEELADIWRELLLKAPHHDFELVSADAVTVDDLMLLLMKLKPVAVHFAGHGVARGCGAAGARCRDVQVAADGGAAAGIVLADEHRRPRIVTAEALAQMLGAAGRTVRLLLLNACHSEAQAGVLSSVVDAVITMNGAIRDDSARSFAAAFYQALGHRRSVGGAFSHAKATLAGKGCPDEDLPRLHTRNGVRARDIVLAHWAKLDTRRVRQLIRHHTHRGCLVGAAVAGTMIVAWVCLAALVLADDYTTDPRTHPSALATERGQPERVSEMLVPAPNRSRDSLGPPTGEQPPVAAPSATDAPLPAVPPRPRLASPPTQLAAPTAMPARLAASPPKQMRPGDTGTPAELDREIVQRYIVRHRDPIRYCYERQRMTRPALAGTVNARFFIASQGRVESSAASGLDEQVATCVAGVIKDIEFPSSGTGVEVTYGFHFVPNDEAALTTADGSGPARP